MDEEQKQTIEAIIRDFECPKDFKCWKSGFQELCKASIGGIDDYLDCLDETAASCTFYRPFGGRRFCQCPLRHHLAKNLDM